MLGTLYEIGNGESPFPKGSPDSESEAKEVKYSIPSMMTKISEARYTNA